MVEVIAEKLELQGHFESQPEMLALSVPEMSQDQMVRRRAAKFIGSCLLGSAAEDVGSESNLAVQPIESLFDAIHLASEGNVEAYKMVETNVRTDIIERTIKTGHIIKVDLQVDEAGRIQQHGQSMESVQANSLRLAADSRQMRERTEAEATNAFRIEQLHRQGKLEDYNFVVFSRAADNMSEQEMRQAGFFTDTMSCAVQVTTADGDRLTTESAFVAGTKKPGGLRHDADTVEATAAFFGVDFGGKTSAEVLDTPLLIHDSLMPNGVVDLVELYDNFAGGTFFGESKQKEDYLEYKEQCQERELMLQPKVDKIVHELIDQKGGINNRLDAVKKLHKLSEKHMVEQAVFDHSINPRVFGSTAATHIEQARMQFELGNNTAGIESLSLAKSTAVSSSCPSSLKSTDGLGNYMLEEDKGKNNDDCEFVSKECPKCGKKDVLTKVTKEKITGSCGCSVTK